MIFGGLVAPKYQCIGGWKSLCHLRGIPSEYNRRQWYIGSTTCQSLEFPWSSHDLEILSLVKLCVVVLR